MCEPITISTGAAWALGAAAAATAAATYVSYDANKKAGEANSEIAANNARLAADDAAAAQAMGDRESQAQTWRTRAIMGQQRAAIAANGIDAGIGTPAEILGETALFGEVDQQAIRLNTARTAWGFNSQARNIQNQAGIDRFNTRAKGTATVLSGISSIASSAGGFYG